MAKEVLLYTTESCPYCHAAIKFLKSKNIPFREIDVTGDGEARRMLVEKSGGRETVPQIFADGKSIGGYDDLVEFYQKGGRL